MINRLFPAVLDNNYRGSKIALYFFWVMAGVTVIRSFIHLVAPDGGAQSIATIPLDVFTPNGAAVVVHLFGLWGLSQLIVGLVYLLSLIRYRALIPLLYLLGILEYAVRLILTVVKPIEIEGTAPGGVGNFILIPVLLIMFFLSLKSK